MGKKQLSTMKWIKILGIGLIVMGIASFIGGNYISSQVNQGKRKVRKAQSGVDAVNSASSSDPALYFFSKAATGPIQKQINEGKRDIVYYQSLAKNLDIAGWVMLVIGVTGTVWAFYRGRRG